MGIVCMGFAWRWVCLDQTMEAQLGLCSKTFELFEWVGKCTAQDCIATSVAIV